MDEKGRWAVPKQEPEVDARNFQGQWSNRDENDLEAGQFRVQLNLNCVRDGELQVRPGLRKMTWDSD